MRTARIKTLTCVLSVCLVLSMVQGKVISHEAINDDILAYTEVEDRKLSKKKKW